MPSRGSYQIANQDERKVTQRDQSFKNCVATLFVFFILLMFVLIANLTWKKSNIKDDDKYLTARQHSDKQRKLENTATTTIETTTDTSVDIIPKENISDNEQTYFFSRYSKNKTKEFGETNTLTTLSDSISTLNNGTKSTDSKDQTSTIVEKIESTEQPNYYSYITGKTLFENDKITENEQDSSTTGSTIIGKIIKESTDETQTSTIVEKIESTEQPNYYSYITDKTLFENDKITENEQNSSITGSTIMGKIIKESTDETQTSTIVEKIESTEQPNYYSYITDKTLFENDKITKNEQDNSTTGSTIIGKIIKESTDETQTNTIVEKIESTEQPNYYSYITDKTLFENGKITENEQDNSTTGSTIIGKIIKESTDETQTSTIVEKIESTEQPNYYSYITGKTLFENDKITENEQDNSTTGSTIIEKIIRDNINETETDNQISTTVYPNISTEYESSSNDSSFDQINSVNNTNTSTEEPNNITTIVPNTTFPYLITSELSTVTDITKNNDSFVKSNITDQFLTSTIVYEPIELTSELTDSGKTSLSQMESTSTEKAVIKEEFVMTSNVESNVSTNNNICNSGHCKQIAARILSYMNHSADPCEDFYEYACGGMIANPQIIDLSLEDKAYHRIAKQMLKDNGGDASSLFTKYYNSCMQYENIDINERIKIVNEAIKKIGRFYAVNETFENHENFTNFYVKLLKTYNPLLFDVALDPEDKPDHITIRVGPVLHKNLFNDKNIDDSCYASETETQEEFVDLEDLYEKYSACKENNAGFIQSIKKALKILGVFNDSASMHEDLNMIGFNINEYLVNNFFSVFPHENKIREAYLQKRYYEVSIDELNKSITFINWYDLKSSLTSKKVNAKFQVYFYEDMKKGLHNLETFRKDSPKDFHNAVLALYAQKLYKDLIIPKHKDMKEYCLKVSINLLEPEASNLYMSSLSDKEITLMSHKIKILFDELKNTLQLNIQNKTWIKNEQRQVLLSKLNDLKLSVPEVSYFQYEEKYKLNISDNYLENSLNLMKRYRSSIYSEISLDINNDITKEIWTHYATPFQSKGIAIHNLNLIIIPFGAIDYGGMFMSNDENSFNYLTWATIGNLIARQIFHHFDSIGIYYSNLTRDTYGNTTFEEYLTCHEDNYSKEKKNIILPHTSQTISYNIPELTLNERLSEIMGLRLTYDTFKRQQSFPNSYLPWLEPNINQLFYLIYAQMYCTKSLLTTSYISLHENEELPSRIRVFISASNNNLLGGTWNCPEGSQILPSSTCDDFPHLIAKDQMNHDINFS